MSSKLQNWLLVVLITLIWGSSFILMKRGLVAFSHTQVAAARLFIASLVTIPLFFRYYTKLSLRELRYIVLIALCGNGIPPFLFTAAQTHLNSSISGILNSTTPLFTLLLGITAFGVSFKLNRLLGVLIGLSGAVFLVLNNGNITDTGNYQYGLLIILATLLYSISANTVKKYCQNIPPAAINLGSFSLLIIPSGIILFSGNFVQTVVTHPSGYVTLGYLVILAAVNTVIANLLFYRLTQRTDAIFASVITYLIPLVSVGLGFLDGETISWQYFVSMAVILLGVYLAQK